MEPSAVSDIYNCTVSIGNKIKVSVEKNITMQGNSHLYKYHAEVVLTEATESHQPPQSIVQLCQPPPPQLTTYRNTLIGTHNFNAIQLIGFIQDLVTSAPQINIKDYSVWLDSNSGPVIIASLKES